MKKLSILFVTLLIFSMFPVDVYAQPSGFGDRSLLYKKVLRNPAGGTTTVLTDGNISNYQTIAARNNSSFFYEFSPTVKVSRVYIRKTFGTAYIRLTFNDGTSETFSFSGVSSPTNFYRNVSNYEKDVTRFEIYSTSEGATVYETDLEEYVELGIPQNLQAQTSHGKVTLSWSPATAATGYYVYLNGVKITETPVSDTTYETIAENDVVNTWQVSATDGQKESPLSDPVRTYFDTVPPASPKGLSGIAGNGWARISWTKNTESDLDGYKIYRDGQLIGTTKENSYTDDDIVNGVQYTYQISAFDKNGNESTLSVPVRLRPEAMPPSAPTGVKTNPGNQYVQIIWNPNPEPDLVGYFVYRDGIRLNAEPIQKTTYTDTGLENFVEYQYQVSAVNTADMESPRSAVVIGIPEDPDTTPPDPPTGVQTTPGDREITITWAPNTEDDLRGYFVYRDGKQLNKEPIMETSYTDTGLRNGREYTYTIRAVDFAGNISDPSEPAKGTPEPPDSAPPENVRARAGNSVVTVTWKEKKGADVYIIYRDGEIIATVTGTEFIDEGVENGTTYEYRVSALVNGKESELSYPVKARPGDFVDFGSTEGQVSMTDVMKSAWNFLQRFNQFFILILSLILVPTILNFIVWLVKKRKGQRDLESRDRESKQAEREPRETEIRERERARDRERIERIERIRERERVQIKRPEKEILSATILGNRMARAQREPRYAGRVRELRAMRPERGVRDERK